MDIIVEAMSRGQKVGKSAPPRSKTTGDQAAAQRSKPVALMRVRSSHRAP
jgi:hypothetical protein